MKRFVFLEITDSEINEYFSAIRSTLYRRADRNRSHLTVRGPYYKEILEKNIQRWESKIESDTLFLGSIDQFNNKKEFVVYIRVESDNLRKIWRKPDYPVEKYGFNPHITLYRGRNDNYARAIADLLKERRLEFICSEFHLTTYVSKQMDMIDNFLEKDGTVSFKHMAIDWSLITKLENIYERFHSVDTVEGSQQVLEL